MPTTIENLEKNIKETGDEFQAGVDQAKKQLQKTGTQLKSQAEDAAEDLMNLVRRHPGKAIGVTLGVGFAIGSLVAAASRRRSSASDQLKGLAENGSDAWSRLRSGFEEAACSLKDAVDDAMRKMK